MQDWASSQRRLFGKRQLQAAKWLDFAFFNLEEITNTISGGRLMSNASTSNYSTVGNGTLKSLHRVIPFATIEDLYFRWAMKSLSVPPKTGGNQIFD